jgi:hypothetical protein
MPLGPRIAIAFLATDLFLFLSERAYRMMRVSSVIFPLKRIVVGALLPATCLPAAFLLLSCTAATTATTTTTTTTGDTSYVAAYKALTWTNATVTFPTSCTMTVTATGIPPYHDPYYLAPSSSASVTGVVATTASGLQLTVTPYSAASITSSTNTINICPTKANSTTSTNMGPIGFDTAGEFLYNAFEATSTPALGDNVSYNYTTGGMTYTASFIDKCNSHATPVTMGYTWHLHGVPLCLTSSVGSLGTPSHIIGIALDGYPVYGGYDNTGAQIQVSQLDACNGITSATPEFPNGAYHYVLPVGVTTKYSSMNCYTGTVSGTLMAEMKKKACRMRDGKYNRMRGSVMSGM